MIFISKLVRRVFLETLIFVFSIYCCLLCIPHANAASVTLVWDPNGEPDISGYRLYYGKASGTFESVIDVGNQTTYNFSDLEDAKTYYFLVTAYDISGRESNFSSELRYPWNSDIRVKDSYGTANRFGPGMWMNQGGESPVYLV
jgi:hypothetical protein